MLIDSHVHIWTGTAPGKRYFPERQSWHVCMTWAYAGGPPYIKDPAGLFPRQELRMSDPEGRYTIESMDHAGVDMSVLLPVDYDLVFGQPSGLSIEEKHQHLAQIRDRYPGRFLALAGPDPRRMEGLDIFKRGINEHGLKGYKIIPACGYYVWDPMLYPFYEFMLDRGLPGMICIESSGGGYRFTRFAEPLHVEDTLAHFPDLSLMLLHAGYPFMHWFEESLHVASRAVSTSLQLDFWIFGPGPMPSARQMAPSIFTNEEAVVRLLARARDVVGMHKLVFGTDAYSGPAWHGERSLFGLGWKTVVDWLMRLPETAAKYGKSFTKEEVAMFLGGNTERMFRLKPLPEEQQVRHKFGWRYRVPIPRS